MPRTAISTEVLRRNSIEIHGKNWKESQKQEKSSPDRARLLRLLLACWAITTRNRCCRKLSSSKESLSGLDSTESKKSPMHANLCKSLSEGNASPTMKIATISPVFSQPVSQIPNSSANVERVFDPVTGTLSGVPEINVEESEFLPEIPVTVQSENAFLSIPPGDLAPEMMFANSPHSLLPTSSLLHSVSNSASVSRSHSINNSLSSHSVITSSPRLVSISRSHSQSNPTSNFRPNLVHKSASYSVANSSSHSVLSNSASNSSPYEGECNSTFYSVLSENLQHNLSSQALQSPPLPQNLPPNVPVIITQTHPVFIPVSISQILTPHGCAIFRISNVVFFCEKE